MSGIVAAGIAGDKYDPLQLGREAPQTYAISLPISMPIKRIEFITPDNQESDANADETEDALHRTCMDQILSDLRRQDVLRVVHENNAYAPDVYTEIRNYKAVMRDGTNINFRCTITTRPFAIVVVRTV
ncbi:MAG: hypothetical protein KF780_12080 [Sphingomonas sp.]|nr:hypothetical protein [Sphingomonas sp.]